MLSSASDILLVKEFHSIGASNMMGKRESPLKSLMNNQKLWQLIVSDTLSVAIRSLTKDCTILRDVMGIVGEICVLVKYSFKRKKMLGSLVENKVGECEKSWRSDKQKLDKLCVRRWTIRTKRFKKILDNCKFLLGLWVLSLKENLDFDSKLRIRGFKNQVKLFKFYFSLNLSQRLYAITNNLSRIYNRKGCLPLEERGLVNLVFKHWKT